MIKKRFGFYDFPRMINTTLDGTCNMQHPDRACTSTDNISIHTKYQVKRLPIHKIYEVKYGEN